MKQMKKLSVDNKGAVKAVVVMILLLVIVLSLFVWTIILAGYFGVDLNAVLSDFGDNVGNIFSNMSARIAAMRDKDEEDGEAGEGEELEESEETGDIESTPPPGFPDVPNNPVPPTPPATPVASPSPTPDNESGEPLEASIEELSASHPDVRKELDIISEQYGSVAVSLAVYDGNTRQYYTYEYGYADAEEKRNVTPNTKFYMASLTKPVTAICAMYLVDEGQLNLDTDVSTYFGYEVRNPNFPDTRITARMLLQHTSSFFDSGAFQLSRDNGSSESVKYLVERGGSFRRNKPGTNFEYTNFGYAVLGALCERISGETLDTLAREVIFKPLGIDAAYVPANLKDTDDIAVIYDGNHDVSRSVQSQLAVSQTDSLGHDLHLAHGNLTISAVDYAKILTVLSGEGAFGETEILKAKSVSEMHNADVEGAGYMQGLATRYSEGEIFGGEGVYWHSGSSYGVFSQYVYDKETNRGVVVVTTGASTNRLDNGMIDVCTALSLSALQIFDTVEEEPDDGSEG